MALALEFTDVTIRRGESLLLDRVSWSVEEDERWVILGPNGAGKTTLLQVAAAQLHPTSGTATVLEETLGAVDVFELRPRIGVASAAVAEPGASRTSGSPTWSSPRRTPSSVAGARSTTCWTTSAPRTSWSSWASPPWPTGPSAP